jgi:hypothetical protein
MLGTLPDNAIRLVLARELSRLTGIQEAVASEALQVAYCEVLRLPVTIFCGSWLNILTDE